MPKRITARTPSRRSSRLLAELVDGEAPERRAAPRFARGLGPDEQRHDEVVEVEPRLADEGAQRARAAQAAKPRGGKGGHVDIYAFSGVSPSARPRTVGAQTGRRDPGGATPGCPAPIRPGRRRCRLPPGTGRSRSTARSRSTGGGLEAWPQRARRCRPSRSGPLVLNEPEARYRGADAVAPRPPAAGSHAAAPRRQRRFRGLRSRRRSVLLVTACG